MLNVYASKSGSLASVLDLKTGRFCMTKIKYTWECCFKPSMVVRGGSVLRMSAGKLNCFKVVYLHA